MLLANGASGVADRRSRATRAFVDGLTAVCRELALGIVRGGEGATKLVTVNVTGAAIAHDGAQRARRRSPTRRSSRPRFTAAIRTGAADRGRRPRRRRVRCSRAAVTIGSLVLFKDGQPHDELRAAGGGVLEGRRDLTIGVDLGAGSGVATVWTCDLSAEYVRINADYRT